jgi:hypothetical protein
MCGDHPLHGSGHPLPRLVPLHAWWRAWRAPLSSHDRPHGSARVRHDLGCFAGGVCRVPCELSNPADRRVPLLLQMAVQIPARLRDILEIRLRAHLMRHGG